MITLHDLLDNFCCIDPYTDYEWKTVRAWEAKDGKMIFYILPPRGKKAKP